MKLSRRGFFAGVLATLGSGGCEAMGHIGDLQQTSSTCIVPAPYFAFDGPGLDLDGFGDAFDPQVGGHLTDAQA
jgi:hypothetical protein